MRGTSLKVDFNNDGIDDVSEWGFGNMGIRFLTVPYLNMQKKMAIFTGLEVGFPTVSKDVLSTNTITLGFQVFAVFFAPLGGAVDLITSVYQHKFSVYEETGTPQLQQGLIDLFILKTFNNKKQWGLINPQVNIDYENSTEFMQIGAEVVTMLAEIRGANGHSVYVRHSVGVGSNRPFDFSVEGGYKIFW